MEPPPSRYWTKKTCDGAWWRRRVLRDVLSKWVRRVHTAWWCGEVHYPGVEGCPHCSRIYYNRAAISHRLVHHTIRSNNGWFSIFVLLWQSWTSQPYKEAALAICSHLVDAFVEWIGRSAHFEAVPLLLEEGHGHMTVAQDRHRQHIWTQEQSNFLVHAAGTASSGSSLQLVGRVPPNPEGQDGGAEQEMPRANAGRLCRCPTRARLMPGGRGGSSPSSSLECLDGADSDDYSIASESGGGHRHWRCWWVERRLAPTRLNLPVFWSTDANADVTYELWHFNVQGWLDQYDKVSMHPHIFGNLQGYPGKWARSLPGGLNIPLDELLRCMDCTFGNVRDYDSMIWSLYEICQKESETVEEYILRVHEVVAVVKHTYPDQVPNEGEGLRWDHFY